MVVIGGGFAGVNVVRGLGGAPASITLVDSHNHHLFQPLLYQVATGALAPGDIAYPIRSMLKRQKNVRVVLDEAIAIETASRRVALKNGTLEYDYLVVATGARDSYFGHDDWRPLAPGLKSLDDAREIRNRILLAFERAERETDDEKRRTLLTFVIIGAGPTGVELAGAIAEMSRHSMAGDFRQIDSRQARIVLVEAGPRVLPAFSERLSAAGEASLRRLGVEVIKNSPVTAMEPNRVVLGGASIAAATALWAAGIGATSLTRTLGAPLDRAGRVQVEKNLTIPGHPEVFVLGDAAAFFQDGKQLPGVAPVAILQGRHTAENLERAIRGEALRDFYYRDKGNLATIGREKAVAQFGPIGISGWPAWVAWLTIHLFFLIGFRNRFIVMFEWAWAYLTYQRGSRLITGKDLE